VTRTARWLAAALLCVAFPAGAKLEAGTTPPDYLGKTPDRDEVHVSQYRGRVVVVTFWASWCGPCRRELPALDALKKAAGDRAEIVAVNVKDTPEDYRLIRRQLKGTALTFTHDRDGKISEAFKVTSYPNLYVIDQAGVISRVHVGFGEGSLGQIIDDINALLVAPKAAAPAAAAAG
jgi:thiol-disulfide isomerase/thioredoxin